MSEALDGGYELRQDNEMVKAIDEAASTADVCCPSCGRVVEAQGNRHDFWICKPPNGMLGGCIADHRPLNFWPVVHSNAIRVRLGWSEADLKALVGCPNPAASIKALKRMAKSLAESRRINGTWPNRETEEAMEGPASWLLT